MSAALGGLCGSKLKIPISEAADVATAKAKKTEEPGKPALIKRCAAKHDAIEGEEP
nr:hypothetical protein [Candidatus Sigynarchaeota archaeon]